LLCFTDNRKKYGEKKQELSVTCKRRKSLKVALEVLEDCKDINGKRPRGFYQCGALQVSCYCLSYLIGGIELKAHVFSSPVNGLIELVNKLTNCFHHFARPSLVKRRRVTQIDRRKMGRLLPSHSIACVPLIFYVSFSSVESFVSNDGVRGHGGENISKSFIASLIKTTLTLAFLFTYMQHTFKIMFCFQDARKIKNIIMI
jgi:hypothetical protein